MPLFVPSLKKRPQQALDDCPAHHPALRLSGRSAPPQPAFTGLIPDEDLVLTEPPHMEGSMTEYRIWKPEHDGHAPPKLTQELLQKLVRYDGGKYYWLERPVSMFPTKRHCSIWNSRFAGKETFHKVNRAGYARVNILGQPYKAHRLIWLYHYGEMPCGYIDHVNGDPSDNRLENLRVVTPRENMLNAKRYNTNKSGCSGVTWSRRVGMWQVRIGQQNKRVSLGYYRDLNAAITARKAAEKSFGYHENHGRTRFEQMMKGEV